MNHIHYFKRLSMKKQRFPEINKRIEDLYILFQSDLRNNCITFFERNLTTPDVLVISPDSFDKSVNLSLIKRTKRFFFLYGDHSLEIVFQKFYGANVYKRIPLTTCVLGSTKLPVKLWCQIDFRSLSNYIEYS